MGKCFSSRWHRVLQTYMDYFYPFFLVLRIIILLILNVGLEGHLNIFKLKLLTFAPEKTKGLNLYLSVFTHKKQGKKIQEIELGKEFGSKM